MMFIILTQQQRDETLSETLQPIEIKSGLYILNLRVLSDPLHAAHHALLASCPQREVLTDEFLPVVEIE